MKLFLIRHGETEDNVAKLWAGVRDSRLTTHGWTQATLLGQHFRSTGVRFTHIFASTLSRAFKTAELVQTAQIGSSDTATDESCVPAVVRLDLLIEKNFGSREGQSWIKTSTPQRQSSQPSRQDSSKNGSDLIPAETAKSMEQRMDRFLDTHLLPLVTTKQPCVVAVVSHGIILAVLWRSLLSRLPPGNVQLNSNAVNDRPVTSLSPLGHWSNTGYLEVELVSRSDGETDSKDSAAVIVGEADMPSVLVQTEALESTDTHETGENVTALLENKVLTVKTINGTQHLRGLKRTRGISSTKHEDGQRSIHTFFKKQRKD